MIWSKYNFIFRSEKYGGLLYNAMTNVFLSVPDTAYEKIAGLHEGDEFTCSDMGLMLQLAAAAALVKPGDDVRFRDVLRMQVRTQQLSDRNVFLAIAPTMACNCACPYCFESHDPVNMDEETEDALIRFINRFQLTETLHISWFGGEPLLRFEQICRLTEKIRKLSFKKYYAELTTNGTLLTAEISSRLEDLAIKKIQITIDGPREIHDSRRKLATGGGTFDTILKNIDILMQSSWKGVLDIRVNVDKDNQEHYADLFNFLNERYRQYYGTRVEIYSGITRFYNETNSERCSCGMNPEEVAQFVLSELKNGGIHTQFSYPQLTEHGCMATCKNAFAVGPKGNLYKCLLCIGNPKYCVGSIFPDKPWDNLLLAKFMEAGNSLNDPECLDCRYFPICSGGCVWIRMTGLEHCSFLKNHLPELLEAHYDNLQKKKACSAEKA